MKASELQSVICWKENLNVPQHLGELNIYADWFLQARHYAMKEGKPQQVIVCFSIKRTHPLDAYIKTSNNITSWLDSQET